MAPLGSAPRNDLAAISVSQPVKKPMPVLAHAVAGLIRPLLHVHAAIRLRSVLLIFQDSGLKSWVHIDSILPYRKRCNLRLQMDAWLVWMKKAETGGSPSISDITSSLGGSAFRTAIMSFAAWNIAGFIYCRLIEHEDMHKHIEATACEPRHYYH